MLSYLLASGMQGTYDALSREAELEDFDAADPKSKFSGLLEKKWTSVIRLQKKVSSQLDAHVNVPRANKVGCLVMFGHIRTQPSDECREATPSVIVHSLNAWLTCADHGPGSPQ